jgi:hypothetical protein
MVVIAACPLRAVEFDGGLRYRSNDEGSHKTKSVAP